MPGRGLAPVMILEIAGDRSVGMMRAIPDVVDHGALRGEFGAHPVVQHVELVLGEEAARHAGLVGEEEHEIAGIVEPADRLRRIRHPANPVPRAHIAVVVIDDAVAVEEGGGPWRGAGGIDAAHFRGGLAHQGLLDLVADAVRDGEMDLLDHRRVVAGRDQQMIAERAHALRPWCR